MHKSIIFLLGLLAFLIPICPSMSNTNVLAFEDYEYEADNYERYAMDMTNDNNYKFEGSDLIKKIKCNNINSNFNGVEANIGTDGPLGGIGAESIQDDASASWFGNGERNNGNFDLDCINTNNNEGGAGQAGPAGPPGPPGITQLDATNIYINTTESRFLGDINYTLAQINCDPGDTSISGGYFATSTQQQFHVDINAPLDSGDGGMNSWTVRIQGHQFPEVFTGYVKCFDNPPLRMSLASSADVSTIQQSEDSPVISQGIVDSTELTSVEKQSEDSPESTATEKITKLKQQWLNLLP